MKPIQRKTWVEVIYWDCGNQDHRHKTEEIATKCIAKNTNKKPSIPIDIRRARWLAAMRAVVTGSTWAEAGKVIGVTPSRTMQIVHKIMRMSTHHTRFSGEYPDHDKYDIKQVRDHADFWLERVDNMAKEWGV